MTRKFFEDWAVCSRCGKARTDPEDIREGFCRFCEDFTDIPELRDVPPPREEP